MSNITKLLNEATSVLDALKSIIGMGKRDSVVDPEARIDIQPSNEEDFLEELHSYIDIFFNETNSYMSDAHYFMTSGDTKSLERAKKRFNKVAYAKKISHDLTELISSYNKVDRDTLEWVKTSIIKPISQISENTKVLNLAKFLQSVLRQVNTRRGTPEEHLDHNEDDIEGVRADNSKQNLPTDDKHVKQQVGKDRDAAQKVIKDLTESYDLENAWKQLEKTI